VNLLEKNSLGMTFQLSIEEAVFVNNALNEVCNGIHIADYEFHARLGTSRPELRKLLDQISSAISCPQG